MKQLLTRLPTRYQILLEIRFFLFALFFPLLFVPIAWYSLMIIIASPGVILFCRAVGGWDSTGEIIKGYFTDFLPTQWNAWWKFLIPVDKESALVVEGLPLNFFELGQYLSVVRSLICESQTRMITPVTTYRAMHIALEEKFPEKYNELVHVNKFGEPIRIERFINTVVEEEYRSTVWEELKRMSK